MTGSAGSEGQGGDERRDEQKEGQGRRYRDRDGRARCCRFVGSFYAEEADVGHATRGHEQANERDEAADDVW